jgi:ferric-dicitrate binding protein FerR (iron transport regulator)
MQVLSNGTFMDLAPEKASFAFAWVDGNFVSEHLPMRKVIAELKRWYTLDVVVKDSSFLDRPVLMTASLDSTEKAIAAFEEGGAVSIAFDAGKRVLKDMASAPKPAKRRR